MRLLIFGLGYAAQATAALLELRGWTVAGTTRDGRDGTIAFADAERVRHEIARADAVLSSVPPDGDADPVLDAYGVPLTGRGRWLGYLSSTGVYGDTGGAWVDEHAPLGGRRPARVAADRAWLEIGARVVRLPGIYGPGRSPLDRVRAGTAHRVDVADQLFSRIHVADIAAGVAAAIDGPAGAYNLADDLPESQNVVVEYAAGLLGVAPPPVVALETLSPMARGFYAENRRVANGKARRVLNWRPRFPDYRFGLRALNAMTSPASTSAAPPPASSDQR